MLRHIHILRNLFTMIRVSECSCPLWYSEFLGANELDDRPFIVMPYMQNGNARDYVQRHPNCDRLKIVRVSQFVLLIHF
jgi:hypothetical protein